MADVANAACDTLHGPPSEGRADPLQLGAQKAPAVVHPTEALFEASLLSNSIAPELHNELRDKFKAIFYNKKFLIGQKLINSFIVSETRRKAGLQEEAVPKGGTALVLDLSEKVLGVPLNLEAHCDDALMMSVITFATNNGFKLIGVMGTYTGTTKESFKAFISGYMYELDSEQEVAHIKLTKDKPFQNGRACARYEMLKTILPPSSQAYIRNIPIEIVGKMGKLKREMSYLRSLIATNILETERVAVYDLLKDCAATAALKKKDKYKLSNFLPSFDDFISKHKRSKRIYEASKKKGAAPIITYENITPTKPSTLSTISPVEKEAVIEVWEAPWLYIKNKRDMFMKMNNCDYLSFNFKELEHDLANVVKCQWFAKSKVLSLTRSREVRVFDKDGKTDITKTVAATREALAQIKSTEHLREYLKHNKKSIIDWIPQKHPINEGLTKSCSFIAYMEDYPDEYRQTLSLMQQVEINEGPPKEAPKSIIDNNRFAPLGDSETDANDKE
jgi:hypothetical protein